MALREKVIERLRKEPESLDMRYYVYRTECGTVGCLAGQIVIAAGRNLSDYLNRMDQVWRDAEAFWENEYGQDSAFALPFTDDQWWDVLKEWGDDRASDDFGFGLADIGHDDVIKWLTEDDPAVAGKGE